MPQCYLSSLPNSYFAAISRVERQQAYWFSFSNILFSMHLTSVSSPKTKKRTRHFCSSNASDCTPQLPLEPQQVLWRGDNQYLPNPRQHQRTDGIVHHRHIINWGQLLAHPLRNGIEARSTSSGLYYNLHNMEFNLCSLKRGTSPTELLRSAMPLLQNISTKRTSFVLRETSSFPPLING